MMPIIEEKIELLKDFCVLARNSKRQELAIRCILLGCRNEYEMERKLHDVIRGNKKLTQLIMEEAIQF